MVQSVASLDFRTRGHKFNFQLGRITFVEIDYKIVSIFILHPRPLIQIGRLSVAGESMYTNTG